MSMLRPGAGRGQYLSAPSINVCPGSHAAGHTFSLILLCTSSSLYEQMRPSAQTSDPFLSQKGLLSGLKPGSMSVGIVEGQELGYQCEILHVS